MITFGIPSFNRARYLAPLVESLYASPLTDFEILLVEDSSPERDQIRAEATRLAAALADERRTLRYVENAQNQGFDKNLKAILAHASGDVVVYIGNDDLVAGDDLATYAAEIVAHPEADVLVAR